MRKLRNANRPDLKSMKLGKYNAAYGGSNPSSQHASTMRNGRLR